MSTKPAISTLFRAKNAIACSAMTIAAFLAFTLTAMPAYAQGAAVDMAGFVLIFSFLILCIGIANNYLRCWSR